jgi:hypothetical protein
MFHSLLKAFVHNINWILPIELIIAAILGWYVFVNYRGMWLGARRSFQRNLMLSELNHFFDDDNFAPETRFGKLLRSEYQKLNSTRGSRHGGR